MSDEQQSFSDLESYNPMAQDENAIVDESSEDVDSLRDIQELTISELFSTWLKSPKQTWQAFS